MLNLRSQRLFSLITLFQSEFEATYKWLQDCFLVVFISPLLWPLPLNNYRELQPFKSLKSKVLPLSISLLGNCWRNITADFAVLMQLLYDTLASLGINGMLMTCFSLGFFTHVLTLLVGTRDVTSLGPGYSCQARSHMSFSCFFRATKENHTRKSRKKPLLFIPCCH